VLLRHCRGQDTECLFSCIEGLCLVKSASHMVIVMVSSGTCLHVIVTFMYQISIIP
jgi:hypothetical protein